MPWWLDVVLLLSGVVLWSEGSRHTDDVIGMLEKIFAVTCVMVVLIILLAVSRKPVALIRVSRLRY